MLDRNLLPEFGDVPTGRIRTSEVARWYAALSARRPGAATSAYRLLRAILATAVRGELIASSPCRGVRGGSDRAPECQLVSMAKVQEIPDAMPERFGAAIVLAWWGALRRGEILGLQRRHLDPSGSSVRVERAAVELSTGEILYGPPKTLAGVRTVHLPPQAAQVQADHVGPDPDDLVFTGRGVVQLRPKTLSTELRRVRALCGVPERRPAEPRPRS